MINIIISLKFLQKISDGLYIRDGLYINLLLPVTGNTLSGRIGKVVASHAEGCNVARSIPAVAELHRSILCRRRSRGTAHVRGECD